jgi:hypothetical protein
MANGNFIKDLKFFIKGEDQGPVPFEYSDNNVSQAVLEADKRILAAMYGVKESDVRITTGHRSIGSLNL